MCSLESLPFIDGIDFFPVQIDVSHHGANYSVSERICCLPTAERRCADREPADPTIEGSLIPVPSTGFGITTRMVTGFETKRGRSLARESFRGMRTPRMIALLIPL
jgi:hypothetical protein